MVSGIGPCDFKYCSMSSIDSSVVALGSHCDSKNVIPKYIMTNPHKNWNGDVSTNAVVVRDQGWKTKCEGTSCSDGMTISSNTRSGLLTIKELYDCVRMYDVIADNVTVNVKYRSVTIGIVVYFANLALTELKLIDILVLSKKEIVCKPVK